MDRLRYHIGRHVYYIGFRMLPANMRRGLSCMSSLGIEWARKNPETFDKVINGSLAIEWEWIATTPAEGANG